MEDRENINPADNASPLSPIVDAASDSQPLDPTQLIDNSQKVAEDALVEDIMKKIMPLTANTKASKNNGIFKKLGLAILGAFKFVVSAIATLVARIVLGKKEFENYMEEGRQSERNEIIDQAAKLKKDESQIESPVQEQSKNNERPTAKPQEVAVEKPESDITTTANSYEVYLKNTMGIAVDCDVNVKENVVNAGKPVLEVTLSNASMEKPIFISINETTGTLDAKSGIKEIDGIIEKSYHRFCRNSEIPIGLSQSQLESRINRIANNENRDKGWFYANGMSINMVRNEDESFTVTASEKYLNKSPEKNAILSEVSGRYSREEILSGSLAEKCLNAGNQISEMLAKSYSSLMNEKEHELFASYLGTIGHFHFAGCDVKGENLQASNSIQLQIVPQGQPPINVVINKSTGAVSGIDQPDADIIAKSYSAYKLAIDGKDAFPSFNEIKQNISEIVNNLGEDPHKFHTFGVDCIVQDMQDGFYQFLSSRKGLDGEIEIFDQSTFAPQKNELLSDEFAQSLCGQIELTMKRDSEDVFKYLNDELASSISEQNEEIIVDSSENVVNGDIEHLDSYDNANEDSRLPATNDRDEERLGIDI